MICFLANRSELLTRGGGTRITCWSGLACSTADVGSHGGWERRAADNSRCDDTLSPQMEPLECSPLTARFVVSDVTASSIVFTVHGR
jgi:hypothetical protein